MGRGLSPLQKWMLYAALDNRRRENRDDDSGAADLLLREIKAGYFKLTPASQSHAKAFAYLSRGLAHGCRAQRDFTEPVARAELMTMPLMNAASPSRSISMKRPKIVCTGVCVSRLTTRTPPSTRPSPAPYAACNSAG